MSNSFQDFQKWLNIKKTVKVHIMDGADVIAIVDKAKIMTASDLNSNDCPNCLTIFNNTTTVDIGSRYINQIIKTGEYWSVFVDGYQHYLFS